MMHDVEAFLSVGCWETLRGSTILMVYLQDSILPQRFDHLSVVVLATDLLPEDTRRDIVFADAACLDDVPRSVRDGLLTPRILEPTCPIAIEQGAHRIDDILRFL